MDTHQLFSIPESALNPSRPATPSLVSAALFKKDGMVKMLDNKTFKKAIKGNDTALVAFVAPWCGHCQRMVPEYEKAALGLYPLIPTYAVNCHAEKNKRLCADQGVQGFPTVKLFPRGDKLPPMVYQEGERTASGFFYFATRRVPKHVDKFSYFDDIPGWIRKNKNKHRALLLTKEKRMPLLWSVLGNRFHGTDLVLASHRDKKGKSSVKMGLEAGGKKEPKVLIYPAGSDEPVRYQGLHKYDSLVKFFDSILDGTADLTTINEQAKQEEFVQDEKEAEIERQQEAQRIALLHGGFTDMIDFEKALKEGAGADFHDSHGYGGMMGGIPEHLKKKDVPETPSPSATESGHSATVTPPPTATPAAEQCTEPPADGGESCGAPAHAEHPKDEL
ncbi:hypothetical protein CVT24_011403 [Panaeolus cyanescens]|uniref:Thioredoxin domain-containing protein n=1 Tax=Panaeolus cyanescens TaxID=181874 RepID=A0A409VG59_9AGAR|nr:hypothetical protein CVT24_011403 [Panaeolus cyanescens]